MIKKKASRNRIYVRFFCLLSDTLLLANSRLKSRECASYVFNTELIILRWLLFIRIDLLVKIHPQKSAALCKYFQKNSLSFYVSRSIRYPFMLQKH